MDALGPVGVRQRARDVTHDITELLGRRIGSHGRLKEVPHQDSADPVFHLWRRTLCVTLIRALKTDGHAAVMKGGFCFAVSAHSHDVYSGPNFYSDRFGLSIA